MDDNNGLHKKTVFTVLICDDNDNIIEKQVYSRFPPAFNKYVEYIRQGKNAKFRHKTYFSDKKIYLAQLKEKGVL